jgi:hypothetical protein
MIHNHKLLNIILPSIVISSNFSYNKHYKNKFNEKFASIIKSYVSKQN